MIEHECPKEMKVDLTSSIDVLKQNSLEWDGIDIGVVLSNEQYLHPLIRKTSHKKE